MPLQSVDSDSYIRRVRVVVDSDKRNRVDSATPFKFVFELPNRLEKVIGVELVGHNIKRAIQKTFEGAVGVGGKQFPANNYIDAIYGVTFSGNPETYAYTTVLPLRNFTSTAALATMLDAELEAQMDPNNIVSLDVLARNDSQVDVGPTVKFQAVASGGTNNVLDYLAFLFRTGPNAHRSAARVMGFAEDRDDDGIFSYEANGNIFQTELQPHRFLEVRIAEFAELDPLARITLTDDFDTKPLSVDSANANVRLLTNPRKELDRIHVELTMADGRPPQQLYADASAGVDLVFDFLVLVPVSGVPRWVDQKLLY
jgi:hypothetical protein